MGAKTEKLTGRQLRFAEFILLGKSSRVAFRLAGYKAKNDEVADASASRLLHEPLVASWLEAKREKITAKVEATAERIIAEYVKIAFSDARMVAKWGPSGVTLHESKCTHKALGAMPSCDPGAAPASPSGAPPACDCLTDEAAACIAEVSETSGEDRTSVRFKMHSKLDALNALAKIKGMFADKTADAIRDLADEMRAARERAAAI